jgi:hypothetical protein
MEFDAAESARADHTGPRWGRPDDRGDALTEYASGLGASGGHSYYGGGTFLTRRVQLVLFDVDSVLTDGSLY